MANILYDLYDGLGLTRENGTQTLINSIRNSIGLENMTEVWDGSTAGLQNFGVALSRFPVHQNAFLNELIDRIGLVVLTNANLNNPLNRFKKGRLDMGRSVQEIFTDLAKAHAYNPEDAEISVFRREMPNTKVLFHDTQRQERYKQTIEHETLQMAFTSVERFESFLTQIYNAMYNSNEVDEYIWTRALIESYVENGFATYVQTPVVTDQVTAQEFVKIVQEYFTRMTLPMGSRLFNTSGVHTRTRTDDVYLLIDPKMQAAVNVDVLAYAFNMDRADLKARTIVVDNFSITGLQAVIVDAEIFKIYDRQFQMRTIENPEGLYWNTNLHVWQLYSMSKFHNFIAFMSEGIPAIERLTLTPMAKNMNDGTSFNFYGIIESVDATTTLTGQVVDATGTAVTGATVTITPISGDMIQGNYMANVTLATGQTVSSDATLVITATNGTTTRTQSSVLTIYPALEPAPWQLGPTGPTGPAGPAGPTGPTGPAGPTG